MQPERFHPTPDVPRARPGGDPPPGAGPQPEVGAFRQGSPWSQWALARYLVGRAITESVGAWLLVAAAALFALAVLSEWVLHSTALSVLLVIVLLGVLVVRWIGVSIVRRLTGFARYGPLEARMQALVRDTRRDVHRELRRIGLPGRTWTMPLLAARLASRRRRAETVERLRAFDASRAVPAARQDEVHLLLREALTGSAMPPAGPSAHRPAG